MTILLTPERVAEIIHLAPSTLAKLRVRGDGPPFVKLGARVFYPEAELEAWLADRLQLRHSTAEGSESERRHGRAGRRPGVTVPTP